MSLRNYVFVWKGPTPSSFGEAWEAVDRKFKRREGEGLAELTELSNRLWARYPYGTNNDSPDRFWLDERISTGHDGTDLLELYPNPKHVGRLLPEIAEEALRLGLTVFDSERSIVFLPSGAVVGKRPAPAHGPTKPEAAPIDHVTPEVRGRLEPMLANADFAHQPRPGHEVIFKRRFAGGAHLFRWLVGSPTPVCTVGIVLSSSYDDILAGMEQCVPGFTASSGSAVIHWTFSGLVLRGGMEFTRLVYPDLTSSIIEVPNKAGSDTKRLDAIALTVRELALPALAATQDIRAVWQLILDESTLPMGGGRAAQWDLHIPILLGHWINAAKAKELAAAQLAHLQQELVQARSESKAVPFRERRLAEFEKFVIDVRRVPPPASL
jgi:hypothetical protein